MGKETPDVTDDSHSDIETSPSFKWAYYVHNRDKNFACRQDTSIPYFEYDSETNNQIEQHYQACLKGKQCQCKNEDLSLCSCTKREFSDEHIITGSQFNV